MRCSRIRQNSAPGHHSTRTLTTSATRKRVIGDRVRHNRVNPPVHKRGSTDWPSLLEPTSSLASRCFVSYPQHCGATIGNMMTLGVVLCREHHACPKTQHSRHRLNQRNPDSTVAMTVGDAQNTACCFDSACLKNLSSRLFHASTSLPTIRTYAHFDDARSADCQRGVFADGVR